MNTTLLHHMHSDHICLPDCVNLISMQIFFLDLYNKKFLIWQSLCSAYMAWQSPCMARRPSHTCVTEHVFFMCLKKKTKASKQKTLRSFQANVINLKLQCKETPIYLVTPFPSKTILQISLSLLTGMSTKAEYLQFTK